MRAEYVFGIYIMGVNLCLLYIYIFSLLFEYFARYVLVSWCELGGFVLVCVLS